MYEREDGELALIDEYANDENIPYLLRRLRDVAERFRPLFATDAEFEAFFPTLVDARPTWRRPGHRRRQPSLGCSDKVIVPKPSGHEKCNEAIRDVVIGLATRLVAGGGFEPPTFGL